ncbi:sarcosine oxidase subunit delta [Pseudohalocynthiibacter aestuariivivens]|uniref:Sarcosine oxidase subunit delta n=1 Tax=Pseudohalocynthiibacter aestuariivivens TaxID=1591409 RepID=A0ABV5JGV6_9RHOB|nr:sarcosine oxidase subunit delta [Pseudohalocynthiibacter aestuariivivens]
MRIKCPLYGERDRREFYYVGDASALDQSAGKANMICIQGMWVD